jgi:hypothetical protein
MMTETEAFLVTRRLARITRPFAYPTIAVRRTTMSITLAGFQLITI